MIKEAIMVNVCHIQWLGQIEYEAALSLQKELVARRAANEIPNTLLLLEHPHIYTIGIDGHREHLLVNQEELAKLNIGYQRVDRGGSVTYHGPGQLACYPILNLQEYDLSYHDYLKLLESVIIHTLASFKVRAFRQRGHSGVWVFTGNPIPSSTSEWRPAQIAAIGVKLNQQHITSHGFFININPDLGFFDLIVPSGLSGCWVTSLSQVSKKPVKVDFVLEPVIQSFCEIFEMEPVTMMTVMPERVENGLLIPA
jgi:lipoate-protein ligase B